MDSQKTGGYSVSLNRKLPGRNVKEWNELEMNPLPVGVTRTGSKELPFNRELKEQKAVAQKPRKAARKK